MPTAPVTYHWIENTVDVINPATFVNHDVDVILPAKHTLRRFVNSTPTFYWKRGSADFTYQEIYMVSFEVRYGAGDSAPVLYKSHRTLKHEIAVDATASVEAVFSTWHGGDLELGFNERAQRGGFYSEPQTLRCSWSIVSSGDSQETLAGEAAVQFRALYSLPINP